MLWAAGATVSIDGVQSVPRDGRSFPHFTHKEIPTMGTQKSNKQLQLEVRDDEAREPSVDKNGNRTSVQDRGTKGHMTPAATEAGGGGLQSKDRAQVPPRRAP